MSISEQLDALGLKDLLICILVQKDIQPVILIHQDQESAAKTKAIKTYYPDLIQSELEMGVLLSKQRYGKETTLEEFFSLLGPCKDMGRHDIITYSMTIVAIGLKQEVELFTQVCKDKDVQIQMKQLAKQAEKEFHTYRELRTIRVEVRIHVNIPILSLIETLLTGNPLNKDEKKEIYNIIWNMSQSNSEMVEYFKREIQYDNPVHQGILLDILLRNHNDTLSPFYPIQYHKEHVEVKNILDQEMANLIAILHRTRKKHRRTRRSGSEAGQIMQK
jgi:hypothetical protein